MSARSATGSVAPSVQKWVIKNDVENQLCSYALRDRLLDKSLSHGSIEVYLRCHNLTAIGWGNHQALNQCPSLLRIDLSGCPKLESILRLTFAACHHLASVLFGEHNKITNLGEAAFHQCYALTSITLPDKLTVLKPSTLSCCSSLERVVCNKKLKTIGAG